MAVINRRNISAALAIGFVVAAAASPALAQKRPAHHPGYAARAQAVPGDLGGAPGSDRERALRECSSKADSMRQYTWGVTQGYMYRNCMAEHGQPE